MKQYHTFHLVTPSPWPFAISLTAFLIPIGAVQYMHNFTYGLFYLIFGLISTVIIIFVSGGMYVAPVTISKNTLWRTMFILDMIFTR